MRLNLEFAPVAVQKPSGSKIRLTKDENSFKVFIPPVGFHPLFGLTSLFAIAWNSFILLWTVGVMVTPFPASFILILVSLPFWGASFLMGNTVLFALFLGIHLRLDRQQIALTWEIFGLKFHRPRPVPRENITKLVYIPKHSQVGFLGARIEVPPQLTIWAATHKYQLCGTGGNINSEAEVQWLAHELSDWLGVEITQK